MVRFGALVSMVGVLLAGCGDSPIAASSSSEDADGAGVGYTGNEPDGSSGQDADAIASEDTAGVSDTHPDGTVDAVQAQDGAAAVDGTSNDTPDGQGDATLAPTYVVETAGTSTFEPWEEVRHLVIDSEGLAEETHTARTGYTDSDIIDAFGDAAPGAGHLLLHISPGCIGGAAAGHVVVLVPGAGSDAQLSWANPPLLGLGLADALIAEGTCVFALTFSHQFGDNLNQAVALAVAVAQARVITGVHQVSVVAHSKGGVVALAYVTGLAGERGAPFAGDVDRLVLLATPIGGTDWSFRHPAYNLPADVWGLPVAGSWDQILEWGQWTDATEDSIYGPAYRGVAQLTARWDETYPLSMLEQDWYTTYEGGDGFVSHSLGIDAAIELGGDFMARLHEHQVPATLTVSIAAGGSPLFNGVALETAGPSDGLVFQQSATQTDLFASPPEVETLPLLNHWDLVASGVAHAWVISHLSQ